MTEKAMEKWALLASYVILVVSVFSIGWIVEHNATQMQDRQCATLAAQIHVNVELTLYARALLEGKESITNLTPTDGGQEIANEIRAKYQEVCGVPLPE